MLYYYQDTGSLESSLLPNEKIRSKSAPFRKCKLLVKTGTYDLKDIKLSLQDYLLVQCYFGLCGLS